MAKKTTTKKAATKKVAAKKTPVKKTAAKKKVAVKKVAAKKVTPAKKAPVKKAAVAQKAPAKKTVQKTSIIARVDVGFGNTLYVRGEGAGLSWTKGTLLDNVSPYEWAFDTTHTHGTITFKFAINDEVWAEGENGTVEAGETSISSPTFAW